ncbi:hypothetical protein BDR03DRAFT_981642 [Suillus americanus]|nr:hypothetical protein BDR03DRAFT_981642 [Suillus americanus]
MSTTHLAMVETCADNQNKRPGLPDLPPKHQKVVDTDFPASEDDAPTGKMKAGGVKKPAGCKATKEQKAHAAGKVAELKMYMEIEDVQNDKLAVRRPRPALNKVPKKPSTQIQSANATNSVHHDTSQNDHNDHSPLVEVSKEQKLCRNIEHMKGSLGAAGGKQSHSKQCACSSDDERPSAKRLKEDPNLFSSQPLQSGLCEGWHYLVSQNIIMRPLNSAPATAGGVVDSMKVPPHNAVRSGGFEDEQEDDEEHQAGSHTKSPTPTITDGDDKILAPLMVSVSKRSPVNKNPAAVGEEQEENQVDNNPLLCKSEPDQAYTELQYEADGASTVDINNAKSKCKIEVDLSINQASTVDTNNAKSKCEFKAQSKANTNIGEEAKQEVVCKSTQLQKMMKTHAPPSEHDAFPQGAYIFQDRLVLIKKFQIQQKTSSGRPPTNPTPSGLNRQTNGSTKSKSKHYLVQYDSDGDDNDNDEDNNNLSKIRHRCTKFTKNDLPTGLHHQFDSYVVPMWIDFISCLDNMWDISDFAEEMQQIWDNVLPNIEHCVSKNKDAVYKVLMQCAYDYHSNFGEQVEIVVAKYIRRQKMVV